MSSYRVTFFKSLLSSDGHPFKCPQAHIEIRHAKTRDRAMRAAQYRYERLIKRPWSRHADAFEAVDLIAVDRPGHAGRGAVGDKPVVTA
jgi:hypothetical protein